ncbi:hypothetical protein PITCH_A2360005 [uncultured Desulfobacterium sp.]|uniref:Uncharacterized protein n=1 Tax=uncultured Desulfobacterium sp. TaxID=201089 RepID=A0A445MYM0_9BACT|nr:hypothetical protein PITCH_A2360005 [uncultured Desulfobacterium sp.]
MVRNLYGTPRVEILNGEILPKALIAYVELNVDFTDAVIGASAIFHVVGFIASFDRKHMNRWAD